MKAGNFNINDYLNRLYEEAEEQEKKSEESDQFNKVKQSSKTGFMDGGEGLTNVEGIVIPDTNKKTYDWLKGEYNKGKTEVKVEMKLGNTKFEPGYDLQTDLDSVKDFKPGMFGEIKTADTRKDKTSKPSLDTKKDSGTFTKGEGDEKKEQFPKTNDKKPNINNKEENKSEEKDDESEDEESKDKTEVKKVDLKTKKK